MSSVNPKLSQDREAVLLKFSELIDKAKTACDAFRQSNVATLPGDTYYELRVSSINLLSRLASEDSVYAQELRSMVPNLYAIKGVLEAARLDYLQGFMADHKLLISAEVFTDLLVQAEVLLDHDYKNAAAVIVRAVLENGIRKLCESHKIEPDKRDTIQQLNEKLYKANAYSALLHKEIIAKAEIGNCAAHGRFDQYTKQDVIVFLEFVLRFLGQYLK
ncbi:MAG: DUF4145 domain-containing protein [Phycisphaerales bacterium]